MRLPPLPSVSDIVRLYKLSAAKKLSQNFILDMTLNRKIVAKAGNLDDCFVCEVGPGPGGITRAILEQNVKHLYVIEKDKRFFPGLQLLSDASGHLTSYHGDVLRFEMDNLFPEEYTMPWLDNPPKLHIIGNLPFNVSIPLLTQYLEAMANRTGAWRYGRTKLTLTFQKEVAWRLAAPVNSEHRCRLSVDAQNWCHVDLKFIIPGRAFVPPPDVDVGVVHLVPRKYPQIDLPYRLIVKLNRHLFHYRNKYCKRSLETLFPKEKPELIQELLEESKVHPKLRPYQLTHEEIGRLCHSYHNICNRLPYIFGYDYRNNKSKKDYNLIKQLEVEAGYSENLSQSENLLHTQNVSHDSDNQSSGLLHGRSNDLSHDTSHEQLNEESSQHKDAY